MKKVLERIHAKLSDPTELYKLHLKHYHMKTKDFRKRTKYLQLPASIYQLYEKVVREKCSTCSRIHQAPPRSKVSGLRAEHFGDLIFIDHTEFKLIMKDGTSASFLVLVGIDAATNLLFAIGVKDNLTDTTLAALEEMFILWNISPKAVCADSAFFKDSFMPYWNYKGCRPLPTGPSTPWPNRAETAVNFFRIP